MRLLLPLALAAVLVACGKPADTPSKSKDAKAPATALILAPEDLLTVQPRASATGPAISGSIQPARRADLRAEVASVVTRVLKDNGEAVRPGDLLLQLDDTALRDALASAQEAVRAAARVHQQAERQLERLRTLQQQGMMSTQAVEDAEVRRNQAQSELVGARAREVTARQQVQRTEVRAPFAGVISERQVSAGDTVQIGRALVKVIDPGSMRFEGAVPADRLGELRPGQTVRFRIHGDGNGELRGLVQRIDPTANPTTRQAEVVVGFAEPASAPRVAGLFAEGHIETGSVERLTLPESALVRADAQVHVWRLQGQALARVNVRLGERDARSGEYPVLDGLARGDRVLRHPGSGLAEGRTVELKAASSGPAAPAASAAN